MSVIAYFLIPDAFCPTKARPSEKSTDPKIDFRRVSYSVRVQVAKMLIYNSWTVRNILISFAHKLMPTRSIFIARG